MKKIRVIIIICIALVAAQTFGFQKPGDDKDEKPKNLKVLSKNLSHDEIIQLMKGYSKSLGVKCGFCHVSTGEGREAKFDFAADGKPEKNIARQMIKMTNTINKKYISKIEGHSLEKVACVTCHMGNTMPTFSVDSLPKKQ
jgi:hypothetical protein